MISMSDLCSSGRHLLRPLQPLVLVAETIDGGVDLVELRIGGAPVGPPPALTRAATGSCSPGDADLEELVEVVGEDRQELRPLEHGVGRRRRAPARGR